MKLPPQVETALAPKFAAPQQGPARCRCFSNMLRSATRQQTRRGCARRWPGSGSIRRRRAPPRPHRCRPSPSVAGAALRDYGGDGPRRPVRPVADQPALRPRPRRQRSLLRWLAARGAGRCCSTGARPAPDAREPRVAGHVERILLPLIDALGEPADLGRLLPGRDDGARRGQAGPGARTRHHRRALAFRRLSGRVARRPRSLGGAAPTASSARRVADGGAAGRLLGLDPARTVAKFAAFGALEPSSDVARRFVTLEDWANDGPPLPLPAARELFDSPYRDLRRVPGAGRSAARPSPSARRCRPCIWSPARIPTASCRRPALPTASSAFASGHVGMIVGAPAPSCTNRCAGSSRRFDRPCRRRPRGRHIVAASTLAQLDRVLPSEGRGHRLNPVGCAIFLCRVRCPVLHGKGARDGQGAMRSLRRSGRRLSDVYARDDLPKLDHYPDGQSLPTPKAIDFAPGELLGCVSGELGLRNSSRSRPHAWS